jgi:hypothetical protein
LQQHIYLVEVLLTYGQAARQISALWCLTLRMVASMGWNGIINLNKVVDQLIHMMKTSSW